MSMQKVKKTAEYTIFQKRSGRYAVKNKSRQWIHGSDKQDILVREALVTLPRPRPPAAEAPAEEAAA